MTKNILLLLTLSCPVQLQAQTTPFQTRYDSVIVYGGSLDPMVWIKNNLDVDHFRTGEKITEAKNEADWKLSGDLGVPAWCYYNNNEYGIQPPGKLYNWWEANDKRGLASRAGILPVKKE